VAPPSRVVARQGVAERLQHHFLTCESCSAIMRTSPDRTPLPGAMSCRTMACRQSRMSLTHVPPPAAEDPMGLAPGLFRQWAGPEWVEVEGQED
jgi:hypothetical protein